MQCYVEKTHFKATYALKCYTTPDNVKTRTHVKNTYARIKTFLLVLCGLVYRKLLRLSL